MKVYVLNPGVDVQIIKPNEIMNWTTKKRTVFSDHELLNCPIRVNNDTKYGRKHGPFPHYARAGYAVLKKDGTDMTILVPYSKLEVMC